jgi:hypothetical protein
MPRIAVAFWRFSFLRCVLRGWQRRASPSAKKLKIASLLARGTAGDMGRLRMPQNKEHGQDARDTWRGTAGLWLTRAGGFYFWRFYVAFEPGGEFYFCVGEGFGYDFYVGVEGFDSVPAGLAVG